MTNFKDDRCTRYDGEDGTAETLGDALGPGVTTDDLAETERVLKRFEAVSVDEFDDCPQWLTTAHRAVCRALEHYDSGLGQQPEPHYDAMRCSDCGNTEFHVPMRKGMVCCTNCGRVTGAVGQNGLEYRGENINDIVERTPDHLNDSQRVREGLLDHPPEDPGVYVSSGAYALRKAHSADELVLYRAIDVIQTND